MNCIFCRTVINDENKSIEHIIPQALGGILTTNKVCVKCNNSFGNDLDRHLVSLMRETAIMLNVSRYSGKNPNIQYKDHYSGEPFVLKPNKGFHAASKILKLSEDKYKVYYKNEKELDKTLKKLNKRGTKNLQPAEESFEEYARPNILFRFSTGDRKQLRAIAKTVVEFYLNSGGDFEFVKHLIPYILGHAAGLLVFPDYKKHPSKENLWDEQVTHSMEIFGGMRTNQLICKISFFETWNYILFLNDSFHGQNIHLKYTQNIKGKILENIVEENAASLPDYISRKDYYEITDEDLFVIANYNTRIQRLFVFETLRPYFDKELEQDHLGFPKGTMITQAVAKEMVLKSVKENYFEVNDYDDPRYKK
ncbi:HNH endonuclease [Leptospira interrogans]|uniref:HNH endonuclease n=1 Tax=Leptospira interrogans TaxID=173 RepID=UPI000773B2A9|nr:HNH endonuclease [Leptospira interrogans]